MTLVSDSVPSMLNGVSQQPPTLRLPSQVGEQINAHSGDFNVNAQGDNFLAFVYRGGGTGPI